MSTLKLFLFFSLCLFSPLIGKGVSYTVEFYGIKDTEILKQLKASSDLIVLKTRSPPSLNALRYRGEADIPGFIKVLKAHGYYEAEIHIDIDDRFSKAKVQVYIEPGPLYRINCYQIEFMDLEDEKIRRKVNLEKIGIRLQNPADSRKIINAELKVLSLLSQYGYPLASIYDRKVIADGLTKLVSIELTVDPGRLIFFGPVKIEGNTEVKEQYIFQKIQWRQGDLYDSRLVEKTQKALMDTTLFGSAFIVHTDTISEQGEIEMRIDVSESKHKSINAGITYETVEGFGVTAGWENRDFGGMGRALSFQGEVSKKNPSGLLSYRIPDFRKINQDLICQLQAMRFTVPISYSERSFSAAGKIERQLHHTSFSLGLKMERLLVSQSAQNGEYYVVQTPLYFRWSSANNLLNATKGFTFEYRFIPFSTFLTDEPRALFLQQGMVFKYYLPLISSQKIVLAQMLTLGSLFGCSLHDIPLSKRFFGGSEDDLRGYRFLTVSPLNADNKPIGGRSEIYYTIETRFRLTEKIGIVPFLDMGNVYSTIVPTVDKKWLTSVGIGLRYFTFVGPFRADVGFPLERRPGIDPPYRLFVSIGQTF